MKSVPQTAPSRDAWKSRSGARGAVTQGRRVINENAILEAAHDEIAPAVRQRSRERTRIGLTIHHVDRLRPATDTHLRVPSMQLCDRVRSPPFFAASTSCKRSTCRADTPSRLQAGGVGRLTPSALSATRKCPKKSCAAEPLTLQVFREIELPRGPERAGTRSCSTARRATDRKAAHKMAPGERRSLLRLGMQLRAQHRRRGAAQAPIQPLVTDCGLV